jgi:hypothetical protein
VHIWERTNSHGSIDDEIMTGTFWKPHGITRWHFMIAPLWTTV